MNILIHKSKLYAIWKEINSKKKVTMKFNTLLERSGDDKIVRSILGLEKDTLIWFCDNKQIFTAKTIKVNEGYKIIEMIGKEFDKRISACWFVDKTLYCINKHGDFISFDPSDILKAEPIQETGNFATITTSANCEFVVKDKTYNCIVIADQYYRIRTYNKNNLHEIHSSLSYKKNYVDKICQISMNEVICFWDDGSVQLLDEEALLQSNNYAGIWLLSNFVGMIDIIAIDIKEDSTFVILEKDACRISFSRV